MHLFSVSHQPPSRLKNWFRIGSIAFGASFGCTLPFTHNLAQSALIGLGAIPGVGATMLVQSRQRRQQIARQMVRGKSHLNKLQRRRQILDRELAVKGKDSQALAQRVAQLQQLTTDLTDRLQRDRTVQQQLERQISTLSLQEQEQQLLLAKLEGKIQDKQANVLELETDFNSLKAEFTNLQTERSQLQSSIDRAEIALGNIRSEIERYSSLKEELAAEIEALYHQQQLDKESLNESIERQSLLLQEIDSAIAEKRTIQEQIESLHRQRSADYEAKIKALKEREEHLANTRSSLDNTLKELADKQSQIAKIDAEINAKSNEINTQNQTLARAELELRDRQTELAALEQKIYAKLQEIDKIELDLETALQQFEPQPPKIDRQIEPIAVAWQTQFADNPHLTVLEHIEKHGVITEAEASSKLGNPRSVRQFANKLEEYTELLPFSIRVESSPTGNRYLKES